MNTEWIGLDDLPNVIKYLRESVGISQKDVSVGSGVGQTLISDYEKGKSVPSLKSFCKLMDFYGYSVIVVPKEEEHV